MPARLQVVLVGVLLLFAAATLGACAGASPTRGWSLTMRINQPSTNKLVAYELRTDGTLLYAAGLRAGASEIGDGDATWQARLSAEELAPAIALLDANPSPAKAPAGPTDDNYRIAVRPPGRFPRTFFSGPTPFLSALHAELRRLQTERRPELTEPYGSQRPVR